LNCERYKVEPYVVPGDVYSTGEHVGRGGWSWYTGAAGWIYRVWLEEILGFQRRGDRLVINPVIPKDWPRLTLRYRYGQTLYEIEIENPDHFSRGVAVVEVDETAVADNVIILRDDHSTHRVRVRLGTAAVAVQDFASVEHAAQS
jgi:cyclic beta-1,2-glucan synthetase